MRLLGCLSISTKDNKILSRKFFDTSDFKILIDSGTNKICLADKNTNFVNFADILYKHRRWFWQTHKKWTQNILARLHRSNYTQKNAHLWGRLQKKLILTKVSFSKIAYESQDLAFVLELDLLILFRWTFECRFSLSENYMTMLWMTNSISIIYGSFSF